MAVTTLSICDGIYLHAQQRAALVYLQVLTDNSAVVITGRNQTNNSSNDTDTLPPPARPEARCSPGCRCCGSETGLRSRRETRPAGRAAWLGDSQYTCRDRQQFFLEPLLTAYIKLRTYDAIRVIRHNATERNTGSERCIRWARFTGQNAEIRCKTLVQQQTGISKAALASRKRRSAPRSSGNCIWKMRSSGTSPVKARARPPTRWRR